MVTKSRLFGGADTWSPNGAIPWGRNYENSLAWYADAGVFLTPMYAYEFEDSLRVSGQMTEIGPDSSLVDDQLVSAEILSWALQSTVVYTTYEIEPENLTTQVQMLSWDLITTVQYSTYEIPSEFMQANATIKAWDIQVVVVSYDTYEPEPITVGAEMLSWSLL